MAMNGTLRVTTGQLTLQVLLAVEKLHLFSLFIGMKMQKDKRRWIIVYVVLIVSIYELEWEVSVE